MRRAIILSVAIILLTGLVATPALGAGDTALRTWTASMGTSGANGRASLTAYRSGIGVLSVNLVALRRSAVYSVQIRAGTCAKPGIILARPAGLTTNTAGAIQTLRPLTLTQMNSVWSVARTKSISLRIVSGTHVRCGNFSFPRATKVTISSYSINLPVIPGPSGYPPCGVAMYIRELWQPREPGVTVIYAHARRGMFLPLLNASKVNNGASMIGKYVKVYTSDSRVHTYRIDRVRRHVRSIQNAVGVTSERLWLYTSEGPNFRYPKLIVEARRISTARTTYSASHPRPRPYAC